MDQDKNIEKHVDRYIEYLKEKQKHTELAEDERERLEKLKSEHRINQRNFEYDYEEDFYEPIYEDDDYE